MPLRDIIRNLSLKVWDMLDPEFRTLITIGTREERHYIVENPDDVSISLAKFTDIPDMVPVLEAADRSDPFYLALSSEEPEDRYFLYRWSLFAYSLKFEFKFSKSKIVVAKNPKTGEVAGFCLFYTEPSQQEMDKVGMTVRGEGDHAPSGGPYKDVTNERQKSIWDQDREMLKEHIPDGRRYCCEYMLVLPKYRGHGVEARMIVYALREHGLEKEHISVRTPVAGRELFIRHGWREIGTIVTDLEKWAGEHKGFGLHSFHILIREPGKLAV